MRRKDDGWALKLPERPGLHLEPCICELLDILEPRATDLSVALTRFSLSGEISIAVYVVDQTPSISLAPSTIRRIASLKLDLDIDVILTAGDRAS
jgi:hypothetical protein